MGDDLSSILKTQTTDDIVSIGSDSYVKSLLQNVFEQAPVALLILKGEDFFVEYVNDFYLQIFGKKREDFSNRPLWEAFPEVKDQGFDSLLKDVYKTGISFHANEYKANIIKNGCEQTVYVNFVYQALYKSDEINGILVIATEVTEQVLARKKVEESEKLFKSLVENAPMPTALYVGKDMVIQLANSEMLKVWGKDVSVIGKKLRDALPELDDQPFHELLNNVYDTGIPYVANEDYARLVIDGKLQSFYFKFSYKPLKDSEGNVYGILNMAVDVTDQVVSKIKLQESEYRLNMAMDFTNTGSFDLDLKTGNIIYTKRLGEIFGYEGSSLISHKTMRKHIHPDDIEIVENAFKEALDTGIYSYQARIVKNDGVINWIATNGRIIYNDVHEPVRMIGTLRDVTDSKTEQDRKDEFIGIVTHELKTPVTSLKAFAQFLGKRFQKLGDQESANFLVKMESQVNKLNILIQDLLNVTKIDGGKLQFNETEFVINDLVNSVVEEMQRTTDKIILVKEYSDKLFLVGDKDRVGQILINLLSNAIKYSPNSNRVIISTKLQNNTLLCCVKDFGIGISKEKQINLFQRFYRVSSNNSDTFPGLGLGLYISSEIAKRQGGKIVVDSEHGKGSTFCLHLPAKVL